MATRVRSRTGAARLQETEAIPRVKVVHC